MTTIQVPMSDSTKRFYQGVASADEVRTAHADLEFPDFDTRIRVFWFYVGVLAGGKHGCESEEDFTNFVSGAATRAPRDDEED